LFLFPPETVHHFSMQALRLLCRIGPIQKLFARSFSASVQSQNKTFFGFTCRNPVGLGAGFDKNARWLKELDLLGFGFVEVGTVTPLPQAGNPSPRLFRLPKDRALINRMGFNNDGVHAVAARLREWRDGPQYGVGGLRTAPPPCRLIVGGNIGKNKSTPNEEAWKDYETCFRELSDCVDYFVVNVSSPNTPGLRALQEKEALRKILVNLQTVNRQQTPARPLLLKISPDLDWPQTDDVVDLALEIKLDGLVISNTSTGREHLQTPGDKLEAIGAGGLSGAPLKQRSTEIIRYIHQKTKGSIPIIASGGVFTADDAQEKIAAGASLVQVWTGFIYEGPRIARNICLGLK